MSTVGIFAGRGDVLVAMGLALLVGAWLGWQAHRAISHFKKEKK